jgi:hypothetical protein
MATAAGTFIEIARVALNGTHDLVAVWSSHGNGGVMSKLVTSGANVVISDPTIPTAEAQLLVRMAGRPARGAAVDPDVMPFLTG